MFKKSENNNISDFGKKLNGGGKRTFGVKGTNTMGKTQAQQFDDSPRKPLIEK